jgi:hypothetical protein
VQTKRRHSSAPVQPGMYTSSLRFELNHLCGEFIDLSPLPSPLKTRSSNSTVSNYLNLQTAPFFYRLELTLSFWIHTWKIREYLDLTDNWGKSDQLASSVFWMSR